MALEQNHPRNTPAPRRGFTLAEIIVAVAAVLILSIGIGQMFGSVSSLISTGSAVGETDRVARLLEDQLRDDIEAFASIDDDESFFAIRSTLVGDVNYNGVLDDDEIAIYLNRQDRDADADAGIAPYEPGSRAVTRRLDELVFLAQSGDFATAQQAGQETSIPTSSTAIVSWGHGLRAAVKRAQGTGDEGIEVDYSESAEIRSFLEEDENFPVRRYYPDGLADPTDPWIEAYGAEFSRNEFASNFPLVRHELILLEDAFATETLNSESRAGPRREVALFPRDRENQLVLGAPIANNDAGGGDEDSDIDAQNEAFTRNPAGITDPNFNGSNAPISRLGLLRSGRVDILSMDAQSLRRYFEGQTDADLIEDLPGAFVVSDATPFATGLLDTSRTNPSTSINDLSTGTADAPLWIRLPRDRADAGPTEWRVSGSANAPELPAPGIVREINALGVQRAIAGVFNRKLVRTEPPFVRRLWQPDERTSPSEFNAEDEFIDNAFILSGGVSNFEIAWSDGTRALRDFDFPDDADNPNDGAEYSRGDIIWFDRNDTYAEYIAEEGNLGVAIPPIVPEIPVAGDPTIRANIDADAFRNAFQNQLPIYSINEPSPNNAAEGALEWSGASPDPANEYLAIWGYRFPSSDGGWLPEGAWRKPELIRVRFTLHDEQNRLPRGKTYEVIISLTARGG